MKFTSLVLSMVMLISVVVSRMEKKKVVKPAKKVVKKSRSEEAFVMCFMLGQESCLKAPSCQWAKSCVNK